jgi:DNA-binding response OmpR family regulator
MNVLRVLLVEDDPLIGMMVADMLGEMGHDVSSIEVTELAAVIAAGRCKPDLMIVDARLGGGSGVFAVEEILRTGFVPHLFMSGNISKVQSLRPDAVVLGKPFSETDLIKAIQRALEVTDSPLLAIRT